jgi:hypothetical protein
MATSATLKALEYTKIAAIVAGTASAESFPDASKRKLRGMYDSWESTVAYDDPSTISFALLPKGCRVLGFLVAWEAQGAAVTADFEIGGVAACAAEAVTDMTSAGELWIPVNAVFAGVPLTADSILTMITKDQALGQSDRIDVTTVYLDED